MRNLPRVKRRRPSVFDMSSIKQRLSKTNLKLAQEKIRHSLFVRYVTISGLYEVWTTNKSLGRTLWLVILVGVAAFAIRDIVNLSIAFLINDVIHTEEQLQLDQTDLVFANVSVCIPVSFDIKRVAQDVVIPDEALRRMRHQNWTVDEVIPEFVRYLSFYNVYEDSYSLELKRVFWLIIMEDHNEQLIKSIGEAVQHYLPDCRDTIVSCTLAEMPFNCCNISRIELSQASVCYSLALNTNDDRSFYQFLPGPSGGLTMDIAWDTANAFYVDNMADDGLYLFVGDVPWVFSVPAVVWPFTHLYVRLLAKQRILIDNCFETAPTLKYIEFYDAAGVHCVNDGLIAFYKGMAGCELPMPPYMPDNEHVCTASVGKMFFKLVVGGTDQYSAADAPRGAANLLSRMRTKMEQLIGATADTPQAVEKFLSNPPHCKRLCRHWKYESIISYASLTTKNSELNSSPDNSTIFRSRVTVYYGDFDYSVLLEQPATNGYIVFAQIGSLLGIYAGISVVTFVQVFIYGVGGIYTFLQRRMLRNRL